MLNYTTVVSCLEKREREPWLQYRISVLAEMGIRSFTLYIFSQMAKMTLLSSMTAIVHKEE